MCKIHISRHKPIIWIFLVFCLLFAFNVKTANAQDDNRRLRWQRFDVTIDNMDTANNKFQVTESYTLDIQRGPFRFGTRSIPMDRLTDINSLRISQDETNFSANCSGNPGSFCAGKEKGQYSITYYFLETANTGDTVHVRMTYTVEGALRAYAAGDQIYWMAIPADRPFPITNSKVTINMPDNQPPQKVASYPDTWQQNIDGNTITWTSPAGGLSNNDNLEVRVQYPHDPQMKAPLWQSAFDFYQSIQPFIDLGMMAIGGLLGIGGPIMMYVQYAKHGRDPEAVVVPEYLTEPPSDELPGVVGTLVDEKADMQDILATLMDLARRGFVVIEQTETEGVFGMFKSHEFVFHMTDKEQGELRNIERQLLRSMFGAGHDVSLSSLKNKFYTHIPTLKSGLYNETVGGGYFTKSPESTRTTWGVAGAAVAVLGVLIMIFGPDMLKQLTSLAFAPGIGMLVSGGVMLLFSPVMPAKTAKGSQEAAKWRAFRTYLSNIKRYTTDMSQANDIFDKYIGYAVAFGLQQQWFHQFGDTLTSMPGWYYPTYMGGHWSGGYRRGYLGQGSGGLSNMGGNFSGSGGLNQMSSSMTQGLNAMSSGLTQMLNSASSVMTSQPSSSGKGGGWSGGGGFSGGSSGGGSAGFG